MFTKQVVRDQILSGSVMGILHSWKAEAGAGSGVHGTGTTLWRKQHFQTQLLLSGVQLFLKWALRDYLTTLKTWLTHIFKWARNSSSIWSYWKHTSLIMCIVVVFSLLGKKSCTKDWWPSGHRWTSHTWALQQLHKEPVVLYPTF